MERSGCLDGATYIAPRNSKTGVEYLIAVSYDAGGEIYGYTPGRLIKNAYKIMLKPI